MKPGDKVTIILEGTIRQVARHTGICFEVELSKEHYGGERLVWVDSEEIVTPTHAERSRRRFNDHKRGPDAVNARPLMK